MTEGYSPIDNSIAKGIDFLEEHQLHNGEIINYFSTSEDLKTDCVNYSITYATSFTCHSLTFLSKNDKVKKIISKAADFLYGQLYYGVWNFCANYHHLYNIVPFDVDSTSLAASAVLDALGGYSGDKVTAKILLANRDKKGLFYTWIVPRLATTYNKRFLRIASHVFLSPVEHTIFWNKTSCNYADNDLGINANVLSYLGDIPETQPIITAINTAILENREATCDKWYYNPFVIYHLFSRNYYKGITKLEPIRQPIIDRIISQAEDSGCLGGNLFNTALGACVLQNFHHQSPVLNKAIQFIIKAQNTNGSWERWAHYYAGNMYLYFGSEEITTAFCLEALSRYRDLSGNN
ncbi:hypothetical protein [Mucilaginibacter sp. L196]|uniref:hypothetical protein n=1 Tax=Mucilaginibacter sp. L196 TaxID=1641870 RepID=UPI00131D6A56|nr:hypothetical protein [Mucilaginibacter sp. L196]